MRKPTTRKGPQVGSGGQRRKGLEGRGPTPKAVERTTHPAAKNAARAAKRDTRRLRVDQVVGVGVVVRRHLEGQALVHGTVGEPVELAPGGLQHRDPPGGGGLQRLADPVVGVDAAGDVHRGDRHVGAQGLDDRVATGDDLARGPRALRRPLASGAGGPACARRGRALGDGPGPACGGVLLALDGLGGGATTLQALAALAAAADGRALPGRALAGRATTLGVTSHV